MNDNFESIIEKIKKIINELEKENIEIDRAIELFEDGINNINLADQKLKNIKNKITKIMDNNSIKSTTNNNNKSNV